MAEFNITMIEDTTPLTLRRVGDKFLIDSFHRHGFKGKQLVRLNLCRLFLQVTTLADIATADGKFITHEARHGILDTTRPSYFTWPNQRDPLPKDWKEWRKALSVSFCGGQDRKLATPMGSWSDKQSDKWRTLNYYIAWQRSTMKFAPNSSRVITGYNKETIAFSLGR
jgi:hypothetical protein